MNDATPWRSWLRAANAMNVPPQSFWRLSMCEWRALWSDRQAMTRAALDALTQRFPDETSQ